MNSHLHGMILCRSAFKPTLVIAPPAATMAPAFQFVFKVVMELNPTYNAIKDMQSRIEALRGYL
jgi:hypothetical protein